MGLSILLSNNQINMSTVVITQLDVVSCLEVKDQHWSIIMRAE